MMLVTLLLLLLMVLMVMMVALVVMVVADAFSMTSTVTGAKHGMALLDCDCVVFFPTLNSTQASRQAGKQATEQI